MSHLLQIVCEAMVVVITDVAHAYKIDNCVMRDILAMLDHVCAPT